MSSDYQKQNLPLMLMILVIGLLMLTYLGLCLWDVRTVGILYETT